MLSHLGRERFSLVVAARGPNVLTKQAQAGVDVSLRINNSGSEGISGGRSTLDFSDGRTSPLCDDASCLDGILLQGLEAEMLTGKSDRSWCFTRLAAMG